MFHNVVVAENLNLKRFYISDVSHNKNLMPLTFNSVVNASFRDLLSKTRRFQMIQIKKKD